MLLLSIHPRFVDSILGGKKKVELRRRAPRSSPSEALIYATAPRMELVASFRIERIIELPVELLWKSIGEVSGVSKREFDSYFHGVRTGVGIHIGEISRLPQPISLDQLRTRIGGFQPPQGFRYVDQAMVAQLGIRKSRRAA